MTKSGVLNAIGAILQNATITSSRGSGNNEYAVTIEDGKLIFSKGGVDGATIDFVYYSNAASKLELTNGSDSIYLANGIASIYGSSNTFVGRDDYPTYIQGHPLWVQHEDNVGRMQTYDVNYLWWSDNGPITELEWDWDPDTGCMNYFSIEGRCSCFY